MSKAKKEQATDTRTLEEKSFDEMTKEELVQLATKQQDQLSRAKIKKPKQPSCIAIGARAVARAKAAKTNIERTGLAAEIKRIKREQYEKQISDTSAKDYAGYVLDCIAAIEECGGRLDTEHVDTDQEW